jgi:hypothetical protein
MAEAASIRLQHPMAGKFGQLQSKISTASYVHGTSESMALAVERVGKLRPIANI